MVIWFLISFLVGLVLALTGSGGGLVSIPLFTQLANIDLRIATVLSLLTVMIGAFVGWLPQRRHTQIPSAMTMFAGSFAASSITSQFKSSFPALWIRAIIICLCFFSLYQFWKGKTHSPAVSTSNSQFKRFSLIFISKNILTGLILGVLTTLTGLGGGVLLVPLMLGFLRFGLTEAIVTSLLTVVFACTGSLWFQRNILMSHINPTFIAALVSGVIASSIAIKTLIGRIPADRLTLLKKITFTLVVCWTIFSLLVQ